MGSLPQSQFPLLQGLLHPYVQSTALLLRRRSQFPLLQGLLHLTPENVRNFPPGLNSHCCRGYCIGNGDPCGPSGHPSQFPLLQGLLHR